MAASDGTLAVAEAARDNIPAELRHTPQWLAWKWEERKGKRTKVPYRAGGSYPSDVTSPSTWTSFEEANAAEGFDGIGFAFAKDGPHVGIDLDNCRDPQTGIIEPWAQGIVSDFEGCYVEASVSGTGIHIIALGSWPDSARNRNEWVDENGKKRGIEVYAGRRYFTISGVDASGTPIHAQAALDRLRAHWLVGEKTAPLERPKVDRSASNGSLSTADIDTLNAMFNQRNGDAIRALYDGDTSAHGGDASAADLALCSHLASATGNDVERIDRLFRHSGLYRDKWERDDYASSTIGKALEPGSQSQRPAGQVGGEAQDEASGAQDEGPYALSLDEFLAEVSETPPALIGEEGAILLPAHGLMILVGKGGRGKTTLTLELILHLICGVPWLGFAVDRPLRVLLIENEGPREPFRRKLEMKHRMFTAERTRRLVDGAHDHEGHEVKGALFVHTLAWGSASFKDSQKLRDFIVDEQIDLVVGDPLDSFGMEGVGSPEDTRKFVDMMVELGLLKDCAFLLLHHPAKSREEGGDELDEASGAWGGKPDSMVKLNVLSDGVSRLSFPKVRWSRKGKLPAMILAFDPDSESFSFMKEEAEEERDLAADLTAVLLRDPWRTSTELARPHDEGGVGANRGKVEFALKNGLFQYRTGDDAVEVGRNKKSKVWAVADGEQVTCSGAEQVDQVHLRPEDGGGTCSLAQPYKEQVSESSDGRGQEICSESEQVEQLRGGRDS